MHTVYFEKNIAAPFTDVKRYLYDFSHYPEYITFVKKVVVPDSIKVGASWFDVTEILWIPLQVKHEIKKIDDRELFLLLSGKGIRYQHELIKLTPLTEETTRVAIEIVFDLTFPWNMLVSKILEKRLHIMCQQSVATMEASYKKEKRNG